MAKSLQLCSAVEVGLHHQSIAQTLNPLALILPVHRIGRLSKSCATPTRTGHKSGERKKMSAVNH